MENNAIKFLLHLKKNLNETKDLQINKYNLDQKMSMINQSINATQMEVQKLYKQLNGLINLKIKCEQENLQLTESLVKHIFVINQSISSLNKLGNLINDNSFNK